jgi:glyoxylase-like metal-dependent hydrolase (beta-lactamase superfamily II)
MIESPEIYTLDLNFQNIPGSIAVYLIPHRHGAVLVECGPGSTLENLRKQLSNIKLRTNQITDILLTHIHLDHAGSAGWWARQGTRIHVHPSGAPHLLNPQKLLSSAERIYGEQMQSLWGEFLPVSEQSIHIVQDGDQIDIENLQFFAVDTPGHANHHHAYIFQDICFSGDIGGVRLQGSKHLQLPMPPPDLHFEKWRQSIKKLQNAKMAKIAPTHFGLFDDAGWQLQSSLDQLDTIEDWMNETMPGKPSPEQLNAGFFDWTERNAKSDRISPQLRQAYEAANPSWMSIYGIQRYWNKFIENS